MIIGETMGTTSENEVLWAIYDTIPKISIDYGIMERADHVYMLQGDFGWNDIGSFDALPALYAKDDNGNVVRGENVMIDATGNIVMGDNKMIACVGVENLIVVDTKDALLICAKDRAQDVKEVVATLEKMERKHLL